MRSTGKDETGAGDDGFGFFDKIETTTSDFKEKWEDPFFRVSLKLVGLALLIGLVINVIIGTAKWLWL